MNVLEALKEIEKFIEKNLSKTKDNESFNLGFDIGIIEKELKALEIIRKCFYVAKSSDAILLTSYGFEHEEELKEVLSWKDIKDAQ